MGAKAAESAGRLVQVVLISDKFPLLFPLFLVPALALGPLAGPKGLDIV